MKYIKTVLLFFAITTFQIVLSQELPTNNIVSTDELHAYLKKEVAQELSKEGDISIAEFNSKGNVASIIDVLSNNSGSFNFPITFS